MIPLFIHTQDPAINLALEEHLCAGMTPDHPGWLLFWRNGPSVIVGRFQNTAAEVNARFVEANRLPVIRRNTGGGAVYHDPGNLNFSFILPAGSPPDGPFGNLTFQDFLKPIVLALGDLGVQAELSGRNDILVDGAKCSGSAQRRTKTCILHHGTLLVDLDLDRLGQALAGNPEKFISKGLASVRSRVTNLRPYLPPALGQDDLIRAIIARAAPGESLRTLEQWPGLTEAAGLLADAKYRHWEWNYGASPRFDEVRSRRFSWGRVDLCLTVDKGTITACRVYGDFFSVTGPESIERLMQDVASKPEAIRQALRRAPLAEAFIGCDPVETLDFLSGL